MKKYLSAIVLVFAIAAIGFSQETKPKPANDSDVVRISTNLIQVDVSVTDKKGNAVTDLKPEEIEIYENGKLQSVSNFNFVPGTRVSAKAAEAARKSSPPPVNLPAPPIRPENVRRTVALVVDDLTLSVGSTVWVKEALKKFVNEQMQEGDLVAIIRTGAGVGALQQFTTDKRLLFAAIDRVKFNASGSGSLAYFAPLNTSTTQKIYTADIPDPTGATQFSIEAPEGLKENEELVTEYNQYRENIFASGTLGALNFIVRGMKQLPGRKSVVLLSDGMKLVTRDANGRPTTTRIYLALQQLIDMANRSSVVFYSIHAPGLVAPGFGAEDELSGFARTGGEIFTTTLMNERINHIDDSQQGLRYLADETGGFAYFNQNDISAGIRRVLEDQSYYLVGYQPDDETFNAKERRFNKFEVKIKREGVKVRYRSGFFAYAEEQIYKPKLSVTETIMGALTSPFAVNDIAIRMNALVAGDEKQGAFVRTFINVDADDLTFKKGNDNRYRTSFDIVAVTLGDNGRVLDERPKNYKVSLDETEYKKFMQRGLVTTFSLPIKKPGGYQVRLAVRDVETDRVGSANQYVEVPNLKKDNLLLSGIALENVPIETFARIRHITGDEMAGLSDPLWDTAVRKFKAGSVLRFGYQIYNAKIEADHSAKLIYHLRLYTAGKIVTDFEPAPIPKIVYESPKVISTIGAIKLGEALSPGDYILAVDLIDGNGKGRSATQFIQFEIVE